jgi:hypothetical protein
MGELSTLSLSMKSCQRKDRKFPQHKQHQTAEIQPIILALKFQRHLYIVFLLARYDCLTANIGLCECVGGYDRGVAFVWFNFLIRMMIDDNFFTFLSDWSSAGGVKEF